MCVTFTTTTIFPPFGNLWTIGRDTRAFILDPSIQEFFLLTFCLFTFETELRVVRPPNLPGVRCAKGDIEVA